MSGRRVLWFTAGAGLVVFVVVAALVVREALTFSIEARKFSQAAAGMGFSVAAGPSHHISFPHFGPADFRMGYTDLPDFARRLTAQGYVCVRQARMTPAAVRWVEAGYNLPWHEKSRAGLQLLDEKGALLFSHLLPQRQFSRFSTIPLPLRDSLLYIENHELLAPPRTRNPAVEWPRLFQAVLDKIEQELIPGHDVPGGSTLATQIEKFRHSPNGLTLTMQDKWQQMVSASMRAYLDGPDTRAARRRIVLDYLNNVPLSAVPGFGEVNGLPDGMWAWYGLDESELDHRLADNRIDARTGFLFRHALSLIIAQRKPSFYLVQNRPALDALTTFYLRLLARKGVIPAALADAALAASLHFAPQRAGTAPDFVGQKAANALRNQLDRLLGVNSFYRLDGLDLTVHTEFNAPAQRRVSDFLSSLYDAPTTQALGLYGHDLLRPGDDLHRIWYSFTLYERTPDGAALRVQADSLDQPFDINRGAKLDLGSTSKLRTLISYLEIVTALHERLEKGEPVVTDGPVVDPISNWAAQWYAASADRSLEAMLLAAMDRTYSANPDETFFTAGGLHHFVNFTKTEDHQSYNLWDATRDSVNLVYIRLMRDIERYYIDHMPGMAGSILRDARDPERRTYLEKFADREGQEFMLRFYHRYRGLTPQQIDAALLESVHPSARRLAAVYRYLDPQGSREAFDLFVRGRADNEVDDRMLGHLYDEFSPGRWSLTDLGYIIQVHPLELWLAGWLRNHPGATFSQAVAASRPQRIEVYTWLFRAGRKNAQDQRIRSLLEVEAFEIIHQDWKRLGYPFDSLVPSYASSLGVSADRPAALAHLMGILLNDGVSLPTRSVDALDFAVGTPYESDFILPARPGTRLLPAELTRVVRHALEGVVQSGTAVRMHNAFRAPDGTPLEVGGKTGTGDHRFDTFDAKGNVLTSRVVNRTATMVFFIGDRFFGTMTALVQGEVAANYHFTSALTAQLISDMSPWLLQPFGVVAPEQPAASVSAAPVN